RMPRRRDHAFFGRAPRPLRVRRVVQHENVGSETPGVFEGSLAFRDLVQAKLEKHDVPAGLRVEEIARDQRESVREPGIPRARRQPFDRGSVPIDGDHAMSRPRVLDELAAARAYGNDRLPGKTIEGREIRNDLRNVRCHQLSTLTASQAVFGLAPRCQWRRILASAGARNGKASFRISRRTDMSTPGSRDPDPPW